MARIGIIGAGISGLVTAWLLREQGHRVLVLERSSETGGALRTTRDRDGWMAEWGPNTIVESSRRIHTLIDRLGLGDRRIYPGNQAKKRYIVRNGHMVAVPQSPVALFNTPLLSRAAKMQVFREPFVRRRAADHEESLADFVRRRLGEEFLTWPIDALVGGIYAGDPEKLSVQHAFPRLALLEQQYGSLIVGQIRGGVKRPPGSDEIPRNKAAIFSFKNGLQELTDRLATLLADDISTSREITRIVPANQTGSDHATDTSDNKTVHHAIDGNTRAVHTSAQPRWHIGFASKHEPVEQVDAVVYAGNAHSLGRIAFPEDLSGLLEPVQQITHPPVVSLTMGFRRQEIAHPLDGFGVLVPGVEQLPILGTLFVSSLFEGRAPDADHVTLTTYMGGMRQPDLAMLEADEQQALVLQALRQILGLKGTPLFRQRMLWARAIPQYEMGHGQCQQALHQAEHRYPGLYFAGNYRTGISVGDTLTAAHELADRIQNELNAPTS